MTDIAALESELLARVTNAKDERALDELRVSALGKKGTIAELLKTLGGMTPDERKTNGPLFNGLRDRVTDAISARKATACVSMGSRASVRKRFPATAVLASSTRSAIVFGAGLSAKNKPSLPCSITRSLLA